MKRFLSGLTCFALLASLPFGFVSAKEEKKVNRQERIAFVKEQMKKIGAKGPEALDEWMLQNGFEKVKMEGVVKPLSNRGQITLGVDAYYDTLTKDYCIRGDWQWDDEQYPDGNEGPEEVIGLVMSDSNGDPLKGHEFTDTDIAVYDQEGNYYPDQGGLTDWSKSGTMFTFQDEWQPGGNYAGYSGYVWAWMSQKPSATKVYVTMSFEHTYNSGRLSDVSINWGWPPSINTTWDRTPSKWTAKEFDYFTSWRRE